MTAITSSQLELLRAKLALAIGPLDVNPFYSEIKAARPNALDEPWSNDMSGPHKHVGKVLSRRGPDNKGLISPTPVFDNKDFVLFEVDNERQASNLARCCPPIDAGENIKLYRMRSAPHSS